MPNSTTEAIILKDFAGGIWLNEGEPPNNRYASFLSNLDPLFGGGYQKRQPMRLNYSKSSISLAAYLAGTQQALQPDPASSTAYVILTSTGLHKYQVSSSTATYTTSYSATSPSGFAYSSSDAGSNWYIHTLLSAQDRIVNSSGTKTTLGTTFNDNIASPTNGNMPYAFCGTQHLAYYFIGRTIESATAHDNRVRWSHPGRHEDWRTDDRQDVGDSSVIVGLFSHRETLLIVKLGSIWLMTGYDPDTFQFHKIVDLPHIQSTYSVLGCSNGQYGVFVFITGYGMFNWNGSKWTDISAGVKDAILDGRFVGSNMNVVGDTLYVSSDTYYRAGAASTTAPSWEYHIPTKRWTRHTACFQGIAEVPAATSPTAKAYALHFDGTTANSIRFSYYRQQQAAGSWCDNVYGSDVNIVCEYRSPWQDAGNPARKKRWKRPFFVFNKRPNASASDPTTYTMTVYKNWDGIHSSKSATVSASKAADTTEYDTNFGYGHASTGSDFDEPSRLSSLGNAYAVQIHMSSTGTPKDQWGFDSLTFKYVPRSLR